jgi:hypothetical protein
MRHDSTDNCQHNGLLCQVTATNAQLGDRGYHVWCAYTQADHDARKEQYLGEYNTATDRLLFSNGTTGRADNLTEAFIKFDRYMRETR